jgi:hypothetical protein
MEIGREARKGLLLRSKQDVLYNNNNTALRGIWYIRDSGIQTLWGNQRPGQYLRARVCV